jgi:hypothetical protein
VPKPETISGCRTGASGPRRGSAHPGDAVAAHEVVGVHHLLDAGNGRDVAADHDLECGDSSRTIRHISRTLPTFTMMEEMPTTS